MKNFTIKTLITITLVSCIIFYETPLVSQEAAAGKEFSEQDLPAIKKMVFYSSKEKLILSDDYVTLRNILLKESVKIHTEIIAMFVVDTQSLVQAITIANAPVTLPPPKSAKQSKEK